MKMLNFAYDFLIFRVVHNCRNQECNHGLCAHDGVGGCRSGGGYGGCGRGGCSKGGGCGGGGKGGCGKGVGCAGGMGNWWWVLVGGGCALVFGGVRGGWQWLLVVMVVMDGGYGWPRRVVGFGCVLGWFMVGGWLMVVMGGEWWW